MSKVRLTQKTIDAMACPKGRRFVYFMDAGFKEFGVQVTNSGAKSYIIRFQYKGKRICRTFAPVNSTPFSRARIRAKELVSEYLEGKDPLKTATVKKNSSALTISQLHRIWLKWAKERKIERESAVSLIYSLRQHFDVEKKKAESLTARDLENFKNARTKAGNKPSSVNRTLRKLKYLYTWAGAQGLLSEDFHYPAGVGNLSEKEISPKTDHLSDAEVKKLLRTVDDLIRKSPDKGYMKPIILFALNTGARVKSIVGLEWRDVIRLDEDGGEIRFRAANIKTRKDINLSISRTAAAILRELSRKGKRARNDRVFTEYSVMHINKSIKKILTAAGLGKYSAYSLRHNYATSLYLAGASPVEIQLQMCHRNYRTTMKYVHGDFEHQKKVANMIKFG